MDFEAVVKRNKRWAWVMMGVMFLVLWIAVSAPLSFFPWSGPLDGDLYYVLATTGVVVTYLGVTLLLSTRINMHSLGGRYPDPNDRKEQRFVDQLEQLSIAAGLPMPQPLIAPDPDINAFAFGLTVNKSYVGVTLGALEHLDAEEMEGILGHELGHIANRDTLVKTLTTSSLGLFDVLIRLTKGLFKFGGGAVVAGAAVEAATEEVYVDEYGNVSRESSGAGLVIMLGALFLMLFLLFFLIVFYVARFIATTLYFAISRRQEYAADARAVEFTRNDRGIARALNKIRRMEIDSPNRGAIAESMYFDSDFDGDGFFSVLFSTHPPLTKRIERVMGRKPQVDVYGRIEGLDDTRVGVQRQAQRPGQRAPTTPNRQPRPAGKPRPAVAAMAPAKQAKRIRCPGCSHQFQLSIPQPKPARIKVACPACNKQGMMPL